MKEDSKELVVINKNKPVGDQKEKQTEDTRSDRFSWKIDDVEFH
ncbi:hypothetical protein P4S80_13480 [Aeribacillus composti]|nr:hypothetical protein [Aeribacillus composti]MED0746893.1 hypothetical protein [Aeribacillus composti]